MDPVDNVLVGINSQNSFKSEFGRSFSHRRQGRERVGIPGGCLSPAKASAPGDWRRAGGGSPPSRLLARERERKREKRDGGEQMRRQL